MYIYIYIYIWIYIHNKYIIYDTINVLIQDCPLHLNIKSKAEVAHLGARVSQVLLLLLLLLQHPTGFMRGST